MDHINSYVLLKELVKFISLNDLNNLRKVNREYYLELKNPSYRFDVLKNEFPLLYNLDDSLNDLLRNSHIDILEFSRILKVWSDLCDRKYGEKYGYLLNQRLIQNFDLDQNKINNTIEIFKLMNNYGSYLMTQQKRAPTNLNRYIMYWISDYLGILIHRKYPNLLFHLRLMDLENLYNMLYNLPNKNIFDFYESICIVLDSNNMDYYPSDLKSEDINNYMIGFYCWLELYNYSISNNLIEFSFRSLIGLFAYTLNSTSILDIMDIHIKNFIKNTALNLITQLPENQVGTIQKLVDISFSVITI